MEKKRHFWRYASFALLLLPTFVFSQNFTEHQLQAGIDHVSSHAAFLGGGAVFFDFDNDGDDDLYITAGQDRDHFYVNQGDPTGTGVTFENRSIPAGFAATTIYYTTGVVAGDIDNDGFKDLFVTTWFSDFEPLARNLLFHNNGDGTFTEIWNQNDSKDKAQSMGATFIDFDLDGLLDLYVVNYVEDAEFLYDSTGAIVGFDHYCFENRFYRNLGGGDFEEISAHVGLDDTGCALAVTASDFDLDGDMDVYLANDFGEFIQPNKLYRNDIDENLFYEVGETFQANAGMYGMGIAVGDIDQDLDLDYYVTNFGRNVLLRNDGNMFTDIAEASGVGDEWIIEDSLLAVGWGTAFLDVDNDGDLDLYVANGYVPSPSFLPSYIFQNDKLFINQGDLVFTDESQAMGIGNKHTSRGMSYSDYDNDGDLDILSVVLNVPVNGQGWQTILYRNETGNQKNWLQVTLEGVKANRDAYGSKIFLFAEGKTLLHEVGGGSSHASQVTSRAHFGLGDATTVDSLQILWTGGKRLQTLYGIDVNQHIHVLEDTTISDTVAVISGVKNSVLPRISISPNPASDWVDIDLGNFIGEGGRLEVVNSLGRCEKIFELQGGETHFRLNISGLESGMYFFLFRQGEYFFIKKIILH